MHDCALKPILLDDAVENISIEVKNTTSAGSKLCQPSKGEVKLPEKPFNTVGLSRQCFL